MSRNDITGDALVSKSATESYRDGWDRIFGKKPTPAPVTVLAAPAPAPGAKGDERKAQTEAWWAYCEKNSRELDTIPTFEQWLHDELAGKHA
jgi:hypothetical protein